MALAQRLLVIEDDAASRRLYESVLGPLGPVTCVETFAEALRALEGLTERDLVVADQRLPDGTGLEVLEAAKARGVGGVLVTADSSLDVLLRAREGGWVVIQKPVEPSYLRSFVDHMLSVAEVRGLAREH